MFSSPWILVLLVIAAGFQLTLFVLKRKQEGKWRKEALASFVALEEQTKVCDRLSQESARDQLDAETARKEMGLLQEETARLKTTLNSERANLERFRRSSSEKEDEERKHFQTHANELHQKSHLELEKARQESHGHRERVISLQRENQNLIQENGNQGWKHQQLAKALSMERALVATLRSWAISTKAELIFVRSYFGRAGQQSAQAWQELDLKLRADIFCLATAEMTVGAQQLKTVTDSIEQETNGEHQEMVESKSVDSLDEPDYR